MMEMMKNQPSHATPPKPEETEKDNPEKTPKIEIRAFHHMSKFSTGDDEWKNWSFDFKTLVQSINPWMTRWFAITETDERELTTEIMQNECRSVHNPIPKDMNIRDKEWFSIICLLIEGEAKMAVRTEESGIAAYQKLHKT